MEVISLKIGEKIRTLRKRKGMTQLELSEKVHVSPQAVSQWERGVTIPDIAMIPAIARKLGTTAGSLLSELDGPGENWTVRDTLFSAEHMYTRMLAFAQAEGLCETYKALPFMKERHAGQFRKQSFFSDVKVPYITHPLMMACQAHALGIRDDRILAAALLHDVCEDCGVAPEDLPVSDEVKTAVRILTKGKDHKTGDAASKERYYGEIAKDPVACFVKILDRCSNISTMAASFPDERLNGYIGETETCVLPLIDRLRKAEPQYSDALYVLKYHMRSVLESVKCMILRSR